MAQLLEFHAAQVQWKKRAPRVFVRRSSVPDGRTWQPPAWHLRSRSDKPCFHSCSTLPDVRRCGILLNQSHSESHLVSVPRKVHPFPYGHCNEMTRAIAFVKVALPNRHINESERCPIERCNPRFSACHYCCNGGFQHGRRCR